MSVKKIRSESGASLTMALLLFLVCSVFGAIILTAATAAAGRVSKLPEMDQRYYSVSSAAQLLAGELGGKTVTVVRSRTLEKTTTTEYTVTEDPSGNEIITPGLTSLTWRATYHTEFGAGSGAQPEDVVITTTDGTEPASNGGVSVSTAGGDRSFLTARALRMLFGADLTGAVKCNTDGAMERSFAENAYTEEGSFSLTHTSPSLTDPDGLTVSGTYQLSADGTLRLTVQSPGEGDRYALTVTLKPDFQERERAARIGSGTTTVTPTASGYIEAMTSVTSLTKTSSVTWNVVGIG